MKPRHRRGKTAWAPLLVASLVLGLCARAADAQTPGATTARPDDTPSIKVGALIFADYTYQQKPQATDSDGNLVDPNSFNVTRSYINITGNISHLVAFRITPDVTRETGAGSSLNGSLTFRLKYAFGQLNLDDWMPKGSWVRLGIQQTPFIDLMEGIYRYRFQGTLFEEREGYMSSSDAGVSFHTAFPGDRGDVHVGVYNGESYGRPEANDQKAVMLRGTVRPLPGHALLRGWRVTGFYLADHYVRSAERTRAILNTTFESRYLNAGFDYLATRDQPSAKPGSRNLHGKGWSAFVTPRLPRAAGASWEALLRYDQMAPNDEIATVGGGTLPGSGVTKRTIAGVAYWFPHQGNVASAVLADVENVRFSDYTPARPAQRRLALHGLISF